MATSELNISARSNLTVQSGGFRLSRRSLLGGHARVEDRLGRAQSRLRPALFILGKTTTEKGFSWLTEVWTPLISVAFSFAPGGYGGPAGDWLPKMQNFAEAEPALVPSGLPGSLTAAPFPLGWTVQTRHQKLNRFEDHFPFDHHCLWAG